MKSHHFLIHEIEAACILVPDILDSRKVVGEKHTDEIWSLLNIGSLSVYHRATVYHKMLLYSQFLVLSALGKARSVLSNTVSFDEQLNSIL